MCDSEDTPNELKSKGLGCQRVCVCVRGVCRLTLPQFTLGVGFDGSGVSSASLQPSVMPTWVFFSANIDL